MKFSRFLRIIFTTLLVVAFVWGTGYLIIKGIEIMKPNTLMVESISKKVSRIASDLVTPTSDKLTVIMAGDAMFDRSIRYLAERKGYDSLFDKPLISLFKSADIAALNLEGPITAYPSKTLVNNKTTELLTFTFSKEVRTTLVNAGIDIVSLANNHVDNFGFPGFMETQDWLKEVEISWFGNPWNSTSTQMSREHIEDNSPVVTIIHKKGFDIAFVGYHAFQYGIDNVISEIKRVSGPNVFTIVMPHWGEEYTSKPSERMKSQARQFIAAGADAVIGAHPHVIMENEWVGPVPVYYSLGNLLFDQYFSPEVMKGLIVELHLSNNSSGIHLDNMETHNVQLKVGKGVVLND